MTPRAGVPLPVWPQPQGGVHVYTDVAAIILAPSDDRWLTWVRRHGIDPLTVPVGSVLRRDVPGRRVGFVRFERDDDGRIRRDPANPDLVLWIESHVQLEAAPLPFPYSPIPATAAVTS